MSSGFAIKKKEEKRTKATTKKKESGSILSMEISLGGSKLSDQDKQSFYLEFLTLVKAGIDIKSALAVIAKEFSNSKKSKIFEIINDRILQGNSLESSMAESNAFSNYELSTINIGEETGQIEIVLEQLRKYFETRVKQKKQFISAMIYPALIVFTSIGAISFMLYFVVPMFDEIFRRFDGELPYITQLIIISSDFVSGNIAVILAAIGIFAGIIYLIRNNLTFKKYLHLTISSLPVIKSVFSAIYLSRLCSAMGLLLASKIPLVKSIQTASAMIDYYPLNNALKQVENDVISGMSFNESLAQHSIFDLRMINLLKIGEEANSLDIFFNQLAEGYSDRIEQQTGILNTVLEPLIIIFMGLIVGIILVAMYLPMFQLSTGLG